MYKLVSTVLESRFKKFGLEIPNNFEVTYIGRPIKQEDLLKACKDADFLFISSVHEVNEELILNSPKLKMIHTHGVGYDKVDLDACNRQGIVVLNNKAINDVSVAELTIYLILEGLRRPSLLQKYIYEEDYSKASSRSHSLNSCELANKTVGLVGLGDIGKQVAKRLNAFDANVLYYKRTKLSDEEEKELNVKYVSLEELLKTSDIVSLHIPSNKETRHIINKDTLSLMKKDAILVNTGRGELINQDDLVECIENDLLGCVCLDVCTPEPAPKELNLLNLKNKDKLFICPHIGGNTIEANKRAIENFLKDLNDFIDNKELKNIVNKIS